MVMCVIYEWCKYDVSGYHIWSWWEYNLVMDETYVRYTYLLRSVIVSLVYKSAWQSDYDPSIIRHGK